MHFDTLHIILPSISLLGKDGWTYFLHKFPLLTFCPYLAVVMRCRLEARAAVHIAPHLPITTFYSFIGCPLYYKIELQHYQGDGRGERWRREDAVRLISTN